MYISKLWLKTSTTKLANPTINKNFRRCYRKFRLLVTDTLMLNYKNAPIFILFDLY